MMRRVKMKGGHRMRKLRDGGMDEDGREEEDDQEEDG